MSLIHFLAVSAVFAQLLSSRVSAVAGEVNKDENKKDTAEISLLKFASSGEDLHKEYENRRKVIAKGMSIRSGQALDVPSGQECSNYSNLTNPDRAQRAVTYNQLCDSPSYNFVPGWYRFTGDTGDKMASTCVPILRCGTASPGWLSGSHPTANSSLARRRVCFHWREDCCHFKVDIWVRNCGDFFVYQLPRTPICNLRYCGDGAGPLKDRSKCGGDVTSLSGQITSPGYPTHMEPISCNWTIKSAFDGIILLYFEEMTLSHEGCSSNNIVIEETDTFCSKRDPFHLLFAKRTVNIHYQSIHWNKISGFKIRYAMIKGGLDNAKVINKWNITVQTNSTSAIAVSWQAIDSSSLKPNESVYGYVVVCKSANQRPIYVLTKPDAATITISGHTGGTEYKVQVVALVNEKNTMSLSTYGSVTVKTATKKGECAYFNNLTTWDRAQGAPGGVYCDQQNIVTPAWYRFGGQAGTQIASSCVPKRRCGTAASGWMDGTHPTIQDGIITRTVCFHWFEDCCRWRVNIRVRNCGGFYVYQLHRPPWCNFRYCGNNGGCGKYINDTSGILTSPGYPLRIYWDSKCEWNLTAPPSGVVVVMVEHLSIPRSARCIKFSLSFENSLGNQVGQACGVQRFFTWMSRDSAKLRFFSERAASRWVGFKARYFIFNDDLTQIPEIRQWTGVSTRALNSTTITVQWGTYPVSPGSPFITEYIIICVPDGLPLNATVFTTDVSQKSLVVTGLMKYTNYTVQIVAQINGKNSSFDDYRGSQKTRVRTKEDVPSEGPQNVKATAMNSTQITVFWQPIPEHARHGEIISYVIFYKRAWTSDEYIRVKLHDNELKAKLRGLEPVTEYRIEVAGATAVGDGTKSKPVFVSTGCQNSTHASKRKLSWSFSSPRYPSNYPSNLDCTWHIVVPSTLGRLVNIYVVFDAFHLESSNACNESFCGKKDPFAAELSKESARMNLKTDGGIEESGFNATVFVVPDNNKFTLQGFAPGLVNEDNEITVSWTKPKLTANIIQYVVMYRTENSVGVWNVTITNTSKATLTGIQLGATYYIYILCYTSGNIVFRSQGELTLEPTGPTAVTPETEEPEEPATTASPTAHEGLYPYGERAGDRMIPNTSYYSTRCFRVNISDDGMQFFSKRHHMIHICRNGILLFETPRLIRWPYRFSEQHRLLDKTAILAPYWAITDVDEAFVTLGVSKVYYKVYKDTDDSNESNRWLYQATYDTKAFYDPSKLRTKKFQATWVLKVTWRNLRFPEAKRLSPILENTFQAVIITNGEYSFAMYNYPNDGIQWSAPTEKKHYKYFTQSRGLPVVGLNPGEQSPDYIHYFDVQGSGTVGIEKVDQQVGLTVFPEKNRIQHIINRHKSPGKWFFRLETMTTVSSYKKLCIDWYKKEPSPKKVTEHLEPCPCTYRQAFWDERFKIEFKGWTRVCGYLVFESDEGWNQECCYDRLTGSLIKGNPGGGTLQFKYNTRGEKYKITNHFNWCCVLSSMCHLYYKKRPSNDCSGYEEPEWSWLWGDPHFVTLDGMNYTFNGLGEYIMADVSNGLFQLQARTKLAKGEGKATVFVSAVAKQNGTSAVQVNLKTGQGLEVLVNGSVIDHSTLTNSATPFNGSIALSRPDDTSVLLLFPCGISVKVTDVKDSLAILLAAPQRFKNKTRGLLGVWNDDPLDDLTTPTGHVLPANATGRIIHHDFGQKWQVTESTTLFTYKTGENVSTFSNSSFEPLFIDDFKFANETLKQEALGKCESDVNCLFDAALTNDVAMGTSTKMVGSRLKNESDALKNSAPLFLNDSLIIYVSVNTTARIEIFAKDDDGDPLSFNVSGILPENLDINTDSSSSIVLVWKVTMAKIKFQVTVMDDKGDVALLRPKVHVCACHNGGYCSKDTNSNNVFADSSNDTFLIMPCTCIHGYTGRFCENDLDACRANLNPCYPGVKCTDLPPPADVFGYKCGPCPQGFSGDGATCLDLDECEGGNDGCSQICVNTPGSFVCDCKHGYRLSLNQKTCNDVDECYPSSDCMQKCKNTIGNYTCECDEGFKVDPYNPKKCVPKLPCTDGNHGCQHICYVKNRQQLCTCYQGYELIDDRKGCKDIDECSTKKYRCNQYCQNTKGSYSCSCKKGFRMTMDGVTCNDVDECMELTYQCPDPSQICRNTAGSYKCVCGLGLYLTVNNTCREIPPGGMPLPTGAPPSPKPPSTNEKNNAVTITVKELKVSDWNEQLEMRFKQSVAKAVTSFCASKSEDCREKQKRERRALDYIPYTADQVHLLPGFPKQINPKSRDLAAVIAFYVEFPPEIVSSSGDSIEGRILVEIVQSAKAAIEKALNRTISSVTLFNAEKPSTKKDPEKFHLYIIIGGSLAGVIFIVIVIVLITRGMSRNEVLRIKRNQENEERRIRSRDVSNECYDDGIHGEFRLGTVSTTDILGENNNECIKTSQHGIDNLYVDTN